MSKSCLSLSHPESRAHSKVGETARPVPHTSEHLSADCVPSLLSAAHGQENPLPREWAHQA